MTTPRRDFLGLLGAATLLGSATPRVLVGAEALPPVSPRREPRRQPAAWDMSWRTRLRGAHRAVFDAPEVSEGDPVLRAVIWAHQMQEVFGTTSAEMSRVLVLRHTGIELAMHDAYWARFDAAERHGFRNAAGAPLHVNPMRAARAEVPEPFRQMTLEQFAADGGIILACDLALRHYVVPRYVATGLSDEAAYSAAVRDLVPGIILQPSGIFAVSVAQEAGCRFVPAS
jgi:hypothetical protein